MFRRFLPAAIILATVTLALATPGLADDCPNAQTAKLGFLLERQGTTAEVRPGSDHFTQVVNTYAGGRKQDVIYYAGLFPISRFDAETRSINVPVSDLRAILPLEPKARRVLTYAPADPGKVGALISLEMTVAGREDLHLGPCRYDVLVIRNRHLGADGRVLSESTDLYSADLGFVLAKRYDEKGGVQTTRAYQSIKSLGKTAPL
jgi:hypothetical protein